MITRLALLSGAFWKHIQLLSHYLSREGIFAHVYFSTLEHCEWYICAVHVYMHLYLSPLFRVCDIHDVFFSMNLFLIYNHNIPNAHFNFSKLLSSPAQLKSLQTKLWEAMTRRFLSCMQWHACSFLDRYNASGPQSDQGNGRCDRVVRSESSADDVWNSLRFVEEPR